MKTARRTTLAARRTPQSRRAAGFTILEVMVVMAMAGLILLVVLQAIPALTRGNRNSQRKQDVQTILQAVSHYELNNSGKFPDVCGDSGVAGQPSCTVAEGVSAPNDYFLKNTVNKLTSPYKDPYHVKLIPLPAGTPGSRSVTAPDGVAILNHQKCKAKGESISAGAGYNDIVAIYALESGRGSVGTPQCQQL